MLSIGSGLNSSNKRNIQITQEPPDQRILRIIHNQETPKTRNFYPRPTFPDMQYEERNQYTQASYTSGTIYEWNIDGAVLNCLQEGLVPTQFYEKTKQTLSRVNAFYVQKQAKLERGTPRLVINHKPLNNALKWIRILANPDCRKRQNIMNEFFNQFYDFIIVYIDDVLVYSIFVNEHWKYLNKQRLEKNSVPWNEEHTKIVKTVKSRVMILPCLALANPEVFKIVEIDTSDIDYGGILKQKNGNHEKLIRKDDVRLLIQEKAKAMAEEKQVFISSYLQDLHIYLSAIPGLYVPGLKLVKDREFDDSKFCRIVEDPLLYQQGTKQLFYKCKRNFTIGRVCLDLQYYKPICLSFRHDELILTPKSLLDYGLVHQLVCLDPNQITNFGRKLVLSLMQGFKMNKKSAEAIIISKAPEWISNGCLLPAQHNISLHYQNRRPTLLSCLLDHTDLCAEPIKNQIKKQGSVFKENKRWLWGGCVEGNQNCMRVIKDRFCFIIGNGRMLSLKMQGEWKCGSSLGKEVGGARAFQDSFMIGSSKK
ncbi:hypothetical protein CK203_017989 [Vitis vinifera]|uniref:Reverse transcriptase/retrotransposon-derived protein RNase H-like domain-containing protein n=1 Tax=Vitis vinifera TaxID=29760 RepID=A0A438JWF6_VITVI|nr:hypothetical protein CK203_017989 [Vitis vinifera]